MSIVLPNIRQHLGASPISGSTAELEAVQKFIADVERDTSGYDSSVCSAAEWLSRQSSEAVDRLRVRLQETLSAGAKRVITSTTDAKTALRAYTAEVEVIHREARAVMIDTEMAFSYIRTAEAKLSEIAHEIGRPGLVPTYWKEVPKPFPQPRLDSRGDAMDAAEREAMISQMRNMYEHSWTVAASEWKQALETATGSPNKWGALWERRKAAEEFLSVKLQDTAVGHLIALGRSDEGHKANRVIAFALTGEVMGETGLAPKLQMEHPILEDLFGGKTGDVWWDRSPEPTQVASWWNSLDPDEAELLIHECSVVIGNLPGLPFEIRDRANRVTLQILAKHPVGLTAEKAKMLSGIQIALESEFAGASKGIARQLASLNVLSDPPCAAVSYGNFDSATHTTWMIAGMESDAAAAVRTWNEVGRNVYAAQHKAAIPDQQNAVVIWLGYDTPNLPDTANSEGVLASNKAQSGAKRLAFELDGAYVAREKSGGKVPVTNVGAHSYGVNTTAIALTLTKHPVSSFTTFGSAGVDSTYVPSLEALNVSERSKGQPAVFAVHAVGDHIAPLGSMLSGRKTFADQPQRVFETVGPQSMGGALTFSAEGQGTAGLAVTDGHSAIGEGAKKGFMGSTASVGHGYFDLKTQSLASFAKITMDPHAAEVPGGFRPSAGK